MAPQLTVTATHTFPHLDDWAACPLSPHASSSGTASIISAAFGYSQRLLSPTTSHSISHDVGLKRNLLMEHQTFNQRDMAQLTQRLSNCLPEMFGCSDALSCTVDRMVDSFYPNPAKIPFISQPASQLTRKACWWGWASLSSDDSTSAAVITSHHTLVSTPNIDDSFWTILLCARLE